MKKLILCFVLITFFSAEDVFASWSNARYFQCAVTKRYTARAKLKPPGQTFYSWTYDGGCSYASTSISSYAVNGTQNCGYATSFRNASGGSGSGWAQCGWSYGENVDSLPAFFSFVPMKSIGVQKPENDENYTYSGLTDNGIEFNSSNRTISIRNLVGRLNVQSLDIANSYSTFQIEIYTYRVTNGEPVKSNVLWRAKASIINGELFLEGDFQDSEFHSTIQEPSYEYSIQGINKSFVLPNGINIDNVCVEISGDGGNLGRGVAKEFAANLDSEKGRILVNKMQSEINFDFNLSQSDKIISASIATNSLDKVIDEISIVSLSGQLVKSKNHNSSNDEIIIDISDIPSGVYLFMIKSGDEYYSKKFIK